MQVGDLVKNNHVLDHNSLGIIVEVSKPQLTNPNACPYRVRWFNVPRGCADYSWNSERWLEILDESR